MRTGVILAGAASVLVVLPLVLAGGRVRNESGPGPQMESYMENVDVISKKSGRHIWSLNAEKAYFPEDGKTAGLRKVRLHIPEEKMTVESPEGVYNMENRDLFLSGGVNGRTESYVIKTGSITVMSAGGVISTDERVRVEGKGFEVEGTGLRSDENKTMRLLRDVKAVFY